MRRKSEWYSPTQKAEALEVIICENQIMTFLHYVNKDNERYTTEISLFEFWKYIQKKKE
jgi:hypothetical protein